MFYYKFDNYSISVIETSPSGLNVNWVTPVVDHIYSVRPILTIEQRSLSQQPDKGIQYYLVFHSLDGEQLIGNRYDSLEALEAAERQLKYIITAILDQLGDDNHVDS